MTEILTDLSPTALAHAVKANQYAYFSDMRRLPHAHFFENDRLMRWHTPLDHSHFNAVLATQPPQVGDESTVSDSIAYFQSQQVNSFAWWLAPELSLPGWEPLLLARGFVRHGGEPGMAIDLATLPDVIDTPAGLQIVTVNDEATLRIWVHTAILGMGIPPAWEAELFDIDRELGVDWPYQYYVAYLDGAPVAVSLMFLGAGVAGMLFVATLPEARRRGIGAAMTAAPLCEARAMGYRVGTLSASDMGLPVYQRLGFRTLCQMDHFVWSPETGGHQGHPSS